MKIKMPFLLLLLFACLGHAQLHFCSWNLCDFGKSKSAATIEFTAETLRGFDLVAIQEVVAGPGGAAAVGKLAAALNRKGEKWDYCVSAPTSGSSYKKERYAYLWKTAHIQQKGAAWLDTFFEVEMDREPYLSTFIYGGKEFTAVNFHAITKNKQPETELKYLRSFPKNYPEFHLLFAGDYNCPQTNTVFSPLKKLGWAAVFRDTKTTLRSAYKANDCLASKFDNVFYNSSFLKQENSGVVSFYTSFSSLHDARKVSDHLPVWVLFDLK
jgi:endonuclease/exonuclease/phosphatase family metal-dependent hydrolase